MHAKPAERILLVDDDQNLLDSLLRKHHKTYDLKSAPGGQEGLAILASEGPFAVVVSDYRMPGMDGVAFLGQVCVKHPHVVRVMLTGNADVKSAINAVNHGQVFRYLTKPCPPDQFCAGLEAALEQYRLLHAERTLLEGTVRGSIEVLADVLALANPQAFGRAERIRAYVKHVVERLEIAGSWQFETAALLSQIGWIAIPPSVLDKMSAGGGLTQDEQKMVDRHPCVAHDLLAKIPRLEGIADMIAHQAEIPKDAASETPTDEISQGSRILSLCLAFDKRMSADMDPEQAALGLQEHGSSFDRRVLKALCDVELPGQGASLQCLTVLELRIGMILDQDVHTSAGLLIVPEGHRITRGMLERLQNYADLGGVEEPINVRVPEPQGARESAPSA